MNDNKPEENVHTHKHGHGHEHGKRKYDLFENMFLLFIITFAAGVFCYEKYMPESFMAVYRTIIFAACIFMWLFISLKSGARGKWQFEIFSVLFWFFPLLEMYLSNNGPTICTRSTAMYVLSEFFEIMFITPAATIGNVFKLNSVAVIIVMALMCSFAFLAGNLFPDMFKKR